MQSTTGPASSATSPPQPARGVKLALLISMNAIYFFAFFHRVAIPGTLFDELQSEFRASAGAIAWLGSIYLYVYAGMQCFAGMMSDRFGATRVLVAGGTILSLGALVFPLAHSLAVLYAARAFVGLGASLIYLSVVKALDGLFAPRRFAELLGVTMFLGYAGGLAGTLPLERAASLWGWRPSLLGVGVAGAAAVTIAWALFRKAQPRMPRGGGSPLVVGAVIRNRLSTPLLIAAPINFAIYFLVQAAIGKKFLLDYGHLSSAVSASFTFAMMLTTMLLGLGGSFFSRLIGNRRKPLVVLSIALTVAALAGLLACLRLHLTGGWLLLCYLLLACSAVGSPLGVALMKELNPPEAVGSTIGVYNALSYVAVALLVTLAGAILDHFEGAATRTAGAVLYPPQAYFTLFAFCFVAALVALTASLFLRESRGEMLLAQEPPG